MEASVAKLLTDSLLDELCQCFALDRNSLVLLGDMENYVFQAQGDQERFVLRLTHSSHRSHAQVRSELDWISHLIRYGADVIRPSLNPQGHDLETFFAEDGTMFFACLFEHAQGRMIDPANSREFSEELFELWGWTLGRLHVLSRNYQGNQVVRPFWHEDDLLDLDVWYSRREFPVMREKADEVLSEMSRWPTEGELGLCLIHADLHQGNFFRHSQGMTVLDFDDSQFHFLDFDFAVILYSVARTIKRLKPQLDQKAFLNEFSRAFFRGYGVHLTPPARLVERLPWLLRLRDMQLYALYRKKFEPESLNEVQKNVFSSMQERISFGEDCLPEGYLADLYRLLSRSG